MSMYYICHCEQKLASCDFDSKKFTISLFLKREALILEFLRVRYKRDILRFRGERKLPSLLANDTLMNYTKILDGLAWQWIKTGFILLEI